MNRRQTKKALRSALATTTPKQDIPTLLGEIQTLAYRVNTETKFCVFLDYSGHVGKDDKTGIYYGQLEMRIGATKGNWDNVVASIDYLYLGGGLRENPIRRLIEIRNNLKYIAEHGKLPYDRMHEVEVTSTEYRLG